MKILCLILGVLLLTTYSGATVAISTSRSNKNCCLDFKVRPIAVRAIVSVQETHVHCQKKGFIFRYPNGKAICYRQESVWARKKYDSFNNVTNTHLNGNSRAI